MHLKTLAPTPIIRLYMLYAIPPTLDPRRSKFAVYLGVLLCQSCLNGIIV
jgi:hypothetical protein